MIGLRIDPITAQHVRLRGSAPTSPPAFSMKKVLKFAGAALLVLVVAGGAFYAWASVASAGVMDRSFTAHDEAFPIPFQLPAEEILNAPSVGRVWGGNGTNSWS